MEEAKKIDENIAEDQFKNGVTIAVVENIKMTNLVAGQLETQQQSTDYLANDGKLLLKDMAKVRHDEGRAWARKYSKRQNKQPNGPT